jgi:hypothetical protein
MGKFLDRASLVLDYATIGAAMACLIKLAADGNGNGILYFFNGVFLVLAAERRIREFA